MKLLFGNPKANNHLISNSQRVKMSGNNKKTTTDKKSKNKQDLGQKVTKELKKATSEVKKDIKDVIHTAKEEKDIVKKEMVKKSKGARDKMMEFYQEHSQVVLFGVVLGGSVIILACGIMKMIC